MAASFSLLQWQLHGLMVITQFLARYKFTKPTNPCYSLCYVL